MNNPLFSIERQPIYIVSFRENDEDRVIVAAFTVNSFAQGCREKLEKAYKRYYDITSLIINSEPEIEYED